MSVSLPVGRCRLVMSWEFSSSPFWRFITLHDSWEVDLTVKHTALSFVNNLWSSSHWPMSMHRTIFLSDSNDKYNLQNELNVLFSMIWVAKSRVFIDVHRNQGSISKLFENSDSVTKNYFIYSEVCVTFEILITWNLAWKMFFSIGFLSLVLADNHNE